jgi:sugar-specific transcriptional regulator TrmB
MFKTKKATVQTLSQEKGQVLEKFQTFIDSIKNITVTALREKEVKLEEAQLAKQEASQLQKIADDNITITNNFDMLINNKVTDN